MTLSWLSDDIVRFKIEMGVCEEMYKNVNTVPDTPVTPQPSLSMTSLLLAGDTSTAQVHREVLM